MSKRKGAAALAACAFLAVGGVVRAAEPVAANSGAPVQLADASGTGSTLVDKPLYLEDQAPAPAGPNSALNYGLGRVGAADWLNKAGIKVGGFAEGSYTYNFRDPDNNVNEGRVFDFEHNAARLNQVAIQIARTPDVSADAKAGKFDVGFGVDMLYGSDGRFIHANGLDGYTHPHGNNHPINQYDLTQAYVDFIVPVGNGLDIRAGKFVTLFGFETISPIATVTGSTGNAFYSHSFSFNFALPFTQTGVTAAYVINDQWKVIGGFTRGWDQATNDSNGAIDFLGQVAYAPNADWSFTLNASVGPQDPNNNHNYRYLGELMGTWAPKNSKWSAAFDGVFGAEEHGAINGDDAYWYGVAGYVGYTICDYAQLNGRAEWFRDDGAFRTGVDASYYEVTLGVKVTPFPHDRWLQNLVLRPEVRGDFSNKDVFNGGKDRNQGTVAIDAIFAL